MKQRQVSAIAFKTLKSITNNVKIKLRSEDDTFKLHWKKRTNSCDTWEKSENGITSMKTNEKCKAIKWMAFSNVEKGTFLTVDSRSHEK